MLINQPSMFSVYKVYWRFNHHCVKPYTENPYVNVRARSENDACVAAHRQLDNPIIQIHKVVKL